MAKDKSPAYQWYPKDILGSARVASMSLSEEGAYRRALDFCWLNGTLPADSKILARVIGKGCTPKMASIVAGMFEVVGEILVHERLEDERNKQKEWKEKSSEGGKKSALARANQTPTTLEPPLPNGVNQCSTLHLHSSSAFSSANTDTKVSKREKKQKVFVAPSQDDFIKYFQENGYKPDKAIKAYKYYESADWHDKAGNKITSWKQKLHGASWFNGEDMIPNHELFTEDQVKVISTDEPNPFFVSKEKYESMQHYYTKVK